MCMMRLAMCWHQFCGRVNTTPPTNQTEAVALYDADDEFKKTYPCNYARL